jgi:RimK family alpha-L-glutamate ligase
MKAWILDKKDRWNEYEHLRFREEARTEGVDISLYDPKDFDIQITAKGGRSLSCRGQSVALPDFVLPRTGANSDYYDMALIRHLERLRIPVVNSSEAIAIARDKLHTMEVLVYHKLPTPKTMLAKFPLNLELIAEEFQFPLIVKSIAGSRGKGVFLCENPDKMEDLMDILELSKKEDVYYVIQEFVAGSKGKDIRVMVVGGRAIGAILREAQEGRYKANISRGGAGKHYELNPEVEWLSIEAARVLGLDIAGVDILFDGEDYKVCEANSGPGFKGFEMTTRLNVPRQIYQYIQVRLSGNRGAATVIDDAPSGIRKQEESVPATDLRDEKVFQVASGYPTKKELNVECTLPF